MLSPSLPTAVKRRSEKMDMPVLYAEAVRALESCATMDEAKYYSDKADALAAWAKIYGSEEDSKAASRLKLHAYARMGQLAEEIRPTKEQKGRFGNKPGPRSLLVERGLSSCAAGNALVIARVKLQKPEEFKAMLSAGNSPTRSVLSSSAARDGSRSSDSWHAIAYTSYSPSKFRVFVRKYEARKLALGLNLDEIVKAKELVKELIDWLDEFDRCLPKEQK